MTNQAAAPAVREFRILDDKAPEAPPPAKPGMEIDPGAINKLEKHFKNRRAQIEESPLQRKVNGLVMRAIKAFKRGKYPESLQIAMDAIKLDETAAPAYHSVALSLEKMGHLHKALQFFEKALELDPQDAEIYCNLGNTAWRLDMHKAAEKFFRIYMNMRPDEFKGHNNLASVLRDMGRFEDGIEIARAAIYRMPDCAFLWNTLGTIVVEQGDVDQAHTFYDEALRLDPKFGLAFHNMGYAYFNTGPFESALAHWKKAVKLIDTENQRAEAEHGYAQSLLALGRLREGWEAWECRHNRHFRGSTLFGLPYKEWRGGDPSGQRIVVVGEQGIGDEIMFANALPDLLDAIGPDGEMILASDRRLVPLFQRSLPEATVVPHAGVRHNGKLVRVVPDIKGRDDIDYYVPLANTLRFYRDTIEDFPKDKPLLKPDPERVAYWRSKLEALGPGPYVGVCWRSMVLTTARKKFYGPLEFWEPVLTVPGARWINLQYDDCTKDKAFARDRFGAEIVDFDEIDLKNDLDDNAALCAALDLVISAPTAAGAIAGAVGTPTWILANSVVWMSLGTDYYPWYPRTDVMFPENYADWPELMPRVAARLKRLQETGTPSASAAFAAAEG